MKGIFNVKSVSRWFFFVFCFRFCLRACSFSQVFGYLLRMSFVRADELESCLCTVEEHICIGWRVLVRRLQWLSSQSVDGV